MNARRLRLCLCFALGSIGLLRIDGGLRADTLDAAPAEINPLEATQATTHTAAVKLLAVGDILFHRPLIRGLKAERDSLASEAPKLETTNDLAWVGPPEVEAGWPFSLLRHLANRADLVVGNLETPINERRLEPPKPMRFSSPVFIAKQLANAGFNALSVANNHAYDQGQRGLGETLDHLKTSGVQAFGLSDKSGPKAPTFIERNGISFAFIGYSFLTNRLPQPLSADESQINLITKRRPRGRKARLKALDTLIGGAKEKADYVIVSVHWGDEYMVEPSAEQARMAKRMVNAGADLILGHHPHVLQPVVRYLRPSGGEGLVAFSLGNFVANQSYFYNLFSSPAIPSQPTTRDSAILEIEFPPKAEEGTGSAIRVRAHPVWLVNRPAYEEDQKKGRRVEPRLVTELQALDAYQDKKRFQRRLKERKRIILKTLGVEEAK